MLYYLIITTFLGYNEPKDVTLESTFFYQSECEKEGKKQASAIDARLYDSLGRITVTKYLCVGESMAIFLLKEKQ